MHNGLKYIFSILLSLQIFVPQFLNAQTQKDNSVPDSEKVFTWAEQKPQFEGDIERYKKTNLQYPKAEKELNIEGSADIKFIVMHTGELKQIEIVKSSKNKNLDSAALNFIKGMPKWKPGKQSGKPVNCLMSFKVPFTITETTASAKKLEHNNAAFEPTYYIVEKQAEFNGNMIEFISSNMRYPQNAIEMGIEGKSIVKFVIDTNGSISDVRISKSFGDTLLDQEAMRVIKIMPNWKPAMQNGKPVKSYFRLPITFGLEPVKVKKD